MRQREIEKIKRLLLARRREILLRYRHTVDLIEEELADPQSEVVETSTDQWDAKVLSRLGEADAAQLGEIRAALRRLDERTYGRCTVCGEAIAADRLEALPEAARCILCARASAA